MTENEIPLHRMTRVVPELQPNTRYSLRVRTVSRFNVPSNWSEAIDFTTPGTNYQPPLPRPLLYEGNTSTEVTSGESALAEFIDGDLKAWPKANIVTTDNIHFSAPFYAPGSLRLDWQWFDDVGSATIELREKESLTIVDKWELPTAPSGGTTFPMHYSSAYEWRLNLGGPAGATGPTNDDARIAVGDRGIYEQVPTNEIVFGRLYDEVDPTFRYETWDPRIASLGNNKFVSIGVMDEDADPSRGLVVEEWTRDGNSVTKDRRTLLTGGGTNETGLGNVAGVHAFDDKFALWVGKGYSEASFGGDFGIMATLIELTDAGAVVRDRVTVDIWSFSATNYDYALTSGITPSDGALLAYMKQTNNGSDIAIHTVRIGRSGNSLTLSHINVPLEQTDYPGNPAIAPISDTSYMVTYTTLDQAPPTPDGPRLRGFVIDETLATPGVSVGPTMITALPHHLALSQDGLAYINRLARHVGGESFTAVYPTSERSGTTGRQYALNVITIDANLGLIRTEDVGWPSAGGSTQSHAGVWHVPGYDHVVAIALDAQNTSWRLLEIKDTGIIQLDESMLETTSHDPSYWNIDFVPFDTVGVVALSTSIAGLEWNDRPFILEFPAIPITSIFSARVRLQGSETALWDLIFAQPEISCPVVYRNGELSHSEPIPLFTGNTLRTGVSFGNGSFVFLDGETQQTNASVDGQFTYSQFALIESPFGIEHVSTNTTFNTDGSDKFVTFIGSGGGRLIDERIQTAPLAGDKLSTAVVQPGVGALVSTRITTETLMIVRALKDSPNFEMPDLSGNDVFFPYHDPTHNTYIPDELIRSVSDGKILLAYELESSSREWRIQILDYSTTSGWSAQSHNVFFSLAGWDAQCWMTDAVVLDDENAIIFLGYTDYNLNPSDERVIAVHVNFVTGTTQSEDITDTYPSQNNFSVTRTKEGEAVITWYDYNQDRRMLRKASLDGNSVTYGPVVDSGLTIDNRYFYAQLNSHQENGYASLIFPDVESPTDSANYKVDVFALDNRGDSPSISQDTCSYVITLPETQKTLSPNNFFQTGFVRDKGKTLENAYVVLGTSILFPNDPSNHIWQWAYAAEVVECTESPWCAE